MANHYLRGVAVSAVIFTVALCCVTPVSAIRFVYSDGTIGNYNLTLQNHYRQVPYYRVGVFAADTWQAAASRRDLQPYVDVSLEVTGFPHDRFEVYVYNQAVLEGEFWNQPGQHPCQDAGQDGGVYILPGGNMSRFAVAFKGVIQVTTNPDGTSSRKMIVSGRLNLDTTGLYIITMNACRYIWKDARGTIYPTQPGPDILAWRTLDTSGWGTIRVNGRIDVRNPYGWVPGQSYGAIPFYVLAFLVTLVISVVWMIATWFHGITKVLTYHWMILAMLVFSMIAYMFMMIYLGAMNETNVNDLALFGFAQVLIIVRSTLTRFVVFLLASGLEITKRDVSLRVKIACFVGAAVYFLILIIMLAISELSGNDSQADHARIIQAEGMGARQGFQVAWFILEVIVAILIFVALHRSIKETAKSSDHARNTMFTRMAILLTVYAVCAFIWFFYVTFAPWGVGTLNESNWQSWWFGPAAWELGYLEVVIGCVAIWFPRRETMSYLALGGSNVNDTANYDHVGGGGLGNNSRTELYPSVPGSRAAPPPPGPYAPAGGSTNRGAAMGDRDDVEMRQQQLPPARRESPVVRPPGPSAPVTAAPPPHDDEGGAFNAA